jgi:5-methylcytosine-specific restriction endonuclease McrBC GTP-binding regulatory subunit McrB
MYIEIKLKLIVLLFAVMALFDNEIIAIAALFRRRQVEPSLSIHMQYLILSK